MPLLVTIPENEYWNSKTEEFINTKETTIKIEHTLATVASWESRWKKPFLSDKPMTAFEFRDYVKRMTIGEKPDDEVYRSLTQENIKEIEAYMADKMTATWFKEKEGAAKKGMPGKVITAEIIYYYMIELGIPFECENWHLNRLMTLIRVCSEKNTPAKKMSKKDVLSQYANLNAARRAKLGTKG